MKVLVTGGMGYIGSHTCVALIQAGFEPVIMDDLSNSYSDTMDGIQKITGYRPPFICGDIRHLAIENTFIKHDIEAVMHFAALKSVSESFEYPLEYYSTNLSGTIGLLEAMESCNIKTFVFSSTAAVYGHSGTGYFNENSALYPSSPYAMTKMVSEQLIGTLEDWNTAILRYFNVTGAHESALIGEHPPKESTNLMPNLVRAADGKQPFYIFGDGRDERDYVHVMDVAEGHVEALKYLITQDKSIVLNLGTGLGTSVLSMAEAMAINTGQFIDCVHQKPRQGDVSTCIAIPNRAEQVLGWKAKRGVDAMCQDSWNFYTTHKDE